VRGVEEPLAADEERLAELAAEIARGAYRVPVLDVADAVLAFHRRCGEPPPAEDEGPDGA
jgi:anti-sigma28 factor (negative regulator of flagellin synthesis)